MSKSSECGNFKWVDFIHGYEDDNHESKGYWTYIGKNKSVKIPQKINGSTISNAYRMFMSSDVEKVSSKEGLISVSQMFALSKSKELDLTEMDMGEVKDTSAMFLSSQATKINLSGADFTKCTNMKDMFSYQRLEELNLSNVSLPGKKSLLRMFKNVNIFKTIGLSRDILKNSVAESSYIKITE